MSSPKTVRVNTIVQWKKQSFVDNLTKFYITSETLLGLNRLPLLLTKLRYIYFPLSIIYSLALISLIIYSTSVSLSEEHILIVAIMNLFEYVFCIIFTIVIWKRLLIFYSELTRFDEEVGCRPKVTQGSIRNILQMFAILIFFVLFYFVSLYLEIMRHLIPAMVPVHFVHCLEVHYYGHLLSLLIPRLRLINYYAESSVSRTKTTSAPKIEEFPYFKYKNATNAEMKKLMDLYHIVIKSYDYLVEAIKWQLLVIIISSFVTILGYSYHVSLSIIRKPDPMTDVVTDVGLAISKMLPLFSPCMYGDRVHSEVCHLREILASRLYENKLDKSSRSTARALLALTETRDLSFSLLRMLEIDISFPFKFMGLLITYLIILLQFEKVINP